MQRLLTYHISAKENKTQLLAFLKQNGFSRNILSSMKAVPGAILLNGERGFGKSILKEGDELHVLIPEEPTSEKIHPTEMTLHILYEDEDILVLNKDAGMPVHPSMGNYENTLANGVAWYYREQDFVFRCINRLDRDTSGALILAKNPYSAAILSSQMKKRQIHRIYLAIVEGIPAEKGTISAPISRVPDSVLLRHVDEKGEPAVTHYERLAVTHKHLSKNLALDYSLVELRLDTGRTHQIRVHMKHLGYPLPGDFLYHPDNRIITRQPLHSYQLSFTHPVTGKELMFTAPVPQDMVQAFL